MAMRYKRPKVPVEFDEWVEKRRSNMEKISKQKVTKMKAMRLISRTEGVDLTEGMIRYLKGVIR